MAEAFTTYEVKYEEGTTTTDDYGNTNTTEGKLTCKDTAPQRLKDMIADKDENDFAYFVYQISVFLGESTANISKINIDKQTKDQLTTLKTKVEIATIETNPTVSSDQQGNAPTTNVDATAAVTLDLTKVSKLYFTDMDAESLKKEIEGYAFGNADIKKAIFDFINAGDVAGLQEYLYKQNGGTDTMRSWIGSRDGKF